MKYKNGFTLIEFLIAFTLSSLILSVVITAFLAAQKNFLLQFRLSRAQENARSAIEFLNASVHMAGYIGCAKLTDDFPLKTHSYAIFTKKDRLLINQNIMTVRHADVSHVNLTKSMHDNTRFYASAEIQFSPNDILLISDCKNAELLQVKDIRVENNEQRIVTSIPLDSLFEKNAEVSRFEEETFFVKATQRKTVFGTPVYALYRQEFHQQADELVEDIQDMKINVDPIEKGIAIQLAITFMPGLVKTWFSYIALRE